jgi:nucleotide-diphospho-sugar transferase
MPPLLFATCFSDRTYDPGGQYPRLAKVLEHTACQHCPAWRHQIEVVPPPPRVGISVALPANVHKMTRWVTVLEACDDGEAVLFLDVDTMILRALDPIWDQPFDFAYTVKPPSQRFPFNTGVVAVRASDRVRAFFRRWHAECLRMLPDSARAYHQRWRAKFGGIHQAALGAVLTAGGASDLQVLTLPCREWNCEDTTWERFDPAITRIVHCKSALRATIFGVGSPTRRVLPLARLWHQLEKECYAVSDSDRPFVRREGTRARTH